MKKIKDEFEDRKDAMNNPLRRLYKFNLISEITNKTKSKFQSLIKKS